jgi:glutamine synthetase
VAGLAKSLLSAAAKLSEALDKHDFDSTEQHLTYSAKTIKPLMDEVRKSADALEAEVADEFWPLPTYQEMLFMR